MLQIEYDCDLPASLRDIHDWKCTVDARMDERTDTGLSPIL